MTRRSRHLNAHIETLLGSSTGGRQEPGKSELLVLKAIPLPLQATETRKEVLVTYNITGKVRE